MEILEDISRRNLADLIRQEEAKGNRVSVQRSGSEDGTGEDYYTVWVDSSAQRKADDEFIRRHGGND